MWQKLSGYCEKLEKLLKNSEKILTFFANVVKKLGKFVRLPRKFRQSLKIWLTLGKIIWKHCRNSLEIFKKCKKFLINFKVARTSQYKKNLEFISVRLRRIVVKIIMNFVKIVKGFREDYDKNLSE